MQKLWRKKKAEPTYMVFDVRDGAKEGTRKAWYITFALMGVTAAWTYFTSYRPMEIERRKKRLEKEQARLEEEQASQN